MLVMLKNNSMEVVTKNAEETIRLGEKVGASLNGGEVLAFVGGLGAGKTTFIQGLAKGLGINARIISPTFILMRSYKTKKGLTLRHLDLYRLEGDVDKEVKNLGLFDVLGDENNIVAIEWAEKIIDIMPLGTKWIKFENVGEDGRKILIS